MLAVGWGKGLHGSIFDGKISKKCWNRLIFNILCQTIKTENIKFKDNTVECSLFKYLIKSELNLVIFYIFYILCKKNIWF